LETPFVVPPLLAGSLTASALHLMLVHLRLPLDRPNERSLHSSPIPRSGGFVAVPAILLAWLLFPGYVAWSIFVATTVLLLVSALDDVRGLPIAIRLACHIAAAAWVAFESLGFGGGWIGLGLAVLAIAWMTNLFNFMDGSDGLAGGMAVIGFASYAAGAWLGGDLAVSTTCFTVAAAAAGFLLHNFHPARVFLGDAGSIPLGFLAGSLGLFGWTRGLWPWWFPLLVFSPFVVDASVTLVRRLLRRERVWQAHREHFYQRLVRSGWGHRRTALVEYVLMIACGASALAGIGADARAQGVLLLATVLAYAVLMLMVDRVCGRRKRTVPKSAQREL
jgi:UDP-N-acetylmuramyl pentapeptide phosphotransferase/UDP-N-acetylglucosamine-1-phosphate transferase